ncbi:MAG: hypothetical protein LBI31_02710 [Zoogloeaceae bacterium]|jgi:hypothetical protein|nr:hypothetical protein [Zoogloeaceae bacterium]
MADVIDEAQEQSEAIDRALLKIKKPEAPAPSGVCLNCAEPLPDGTRWCSVECRDDWERFDAMLRKQGL